MKHKKVKQHEFYKVSGSLVEKIRRSCPRCGDSFLAAHKQSDGKTRYYCGKCHMSIWE